ncbi:MAG: hypothetical protein RMK01_00020 [Thermomicrobium sp.]|nr:hypothetical protein [Thermomicrobium sp.]MDW8058441.1 hypothetical protein [Thermomicrobium sp.]
MKDRIARSALDRFSDPAIVAIWSLGLLLRLVAMPLTFHTDLYQIYSRAALALATGDWFAWNSQLVAQLVHTLWFFLVRPALPGSDGLWSPTAGVAGIGAQPADVERFLQYPLLARALVLLKLPYLAGDAVTGWLLARLAPEERRRWVLGLWWLNPIVVYTSACFGRHDTLWIALLVTGAAAAALDRRWWGFALTTLAAAARFFPVFVIPFYLVSFRRSWRQVLVGFGAVAFAWLAVDAAFVFRRGVSPTLTLLGDYPHVRYLVAVALPAGGDVPLPVFPLLYTVVLCAWLRRAPQGIGAYRAAAAAVLCAVVALTPVHPQYVVWALPFAVPVLARDGVGRSLAVVQAGAFLLWLLRWGAPVTTELFLPLGDEFVRSLPDPQLVAAALVPASVWQPALRAVLTGVTLWIGWLAVEEELRRRSGRREPAVQVVGDER